VGDRIEGFVNAAPLHRLDYLSFDERFGHEDTLYIIDVAVSRAFRNRGYGSLMLAHGLRGEFRRYTRTPWEMLQEPVSAGRFSRGGRVCKLDGGKARDLHGHRIKTAGIPGLNDKKSP
jgi:GNAT superfamily N-acetyltransferase